MSDKLDDLIDKASTHTEDLEAGLPAGMQAPFKKRSWLLIALLILLLINAGVVITTNIQNKTSMTEDVAELFNMASSEVNSEYKRIGALPDSLAAPLLAESLSYRVTGNDSYVLGYSDGENSFSVELNTTEAFSIDQIR